MKRVFIKIKLMVIRRVRLIKVIFPKTDIMLYVLLMLLWLAFGYIVKYISYIHDGDNATYLRTIWNLKNSIFTSIVLAFAIGAFNRLRDYRKCLKRQHFMYVDSMDDFEEIFKAVEDEEYWIHFHALYNDKCKQIAWDLIKSKVSQIKEYDKGIWVALRTIRDRLEVIDYQLKNEMLIVEDEEILALEIADAKKYILRIEQEESFELLDSLINELLLILDQLRYLWRRDLKLNLKLINMMQNPESNFYMRMWLPNFGIDMVKGWQ